jgi:uncharacterized membrane protein YhaH (DUF805 family)
MKAVGFLNARINRTVYWTAISGGAAIYGILYFVSQKHVSVSEALLILIAIPRLHDIGLSGWWAGGVFVAEIVIGILALTMIPLEQAAIVMGITVLLIAGLMVWLGCKPGEAVANAFGGPPLPGLSLEQSPEKRAQFNE